MSEPFIGELTLFGGNFAPRGYAFCNGGILGIAQNTALFSLIGTIYGGNGQTTFALPNLAGRAVAGQGQGPGLVTRTMGEQYGTESETLTTNQMPGHVHGMVLVAQNDPAKRSHSPSSGNALSVSSNTSVLNFKPAGQPATTFAPNLVGVTGGAQPHENRQPFLGVTYCIALQGIFPSRN
jgi:microcystin-dependent protein